MEPDIDTIDELIDVVSAMMKLTEQQRFVLERTAEGYGQVEIGKMLELSHSTINRILKDARKELCKLLS